MESSLYFWKSYSTCIGFSSNLKKNLSPPIAIGVTLSSFILSVKIYTIQKPIFHFIHKTLRADYFYPAAMR